MFGKKSHAAEVHAIFEPTDSTLSAKDQIHNLENAITSLFTTWFPECMSLVWKRYFLTDVANQFQFIDCTGDEVISVIQQPPLNGSKVSAWVYGIENIGIEKAASGAVCVKRPFYTHLFHTQLQANEGNSFEQTTSIFTRYIDSLHSFQTKLSSHCIRTWLYVQQIDVQYAGMVNARRMIFQRENLTPATHFIASTGIEGRSFFPGVSVMMDAYAIPEIGEDQVTYLKGTGYLNPTHEYGVTFERGTVVSYGDREHVFISGTASINDRGEIVHPLDIQKQTERSFENMGALLSEAGCSFSDLAYLLVYLRDVADYKLVDAHLQAKFPHLPMIILLAPVCRPGWLIEIEGMAIRAINNNRFKHF